MALRARPAVSRAASADFTTASSRLVGADPVSADPLRAWAVVAIMRLSSIPLPVPPRPQCGWKRPRFQAAPVDHCDAMIGPVRGAKPNGCGTLFDPEPRNGTGAFAFP